MEEIESRIHLKITDIKCERVQNISEEDANREGVKGMHHMNTPPYSLILYRDKFKDVWININGPDSWDDNPWVFAYEFEKYNK